jgi:hypothetical protein
MSPGVAELGLCFLWITSVTFWLKDRMAPQLQESSELSLKLFVFLFHPPTLFSFEEGAIGYLSPMPGFASCAPPQIGDSTFP